MKNNSREMRRNVSVLFLITHLRSRTHTHKHWTSDNEEKKKTSVDRHSNNIKNKHTHAHIHISSWFFLRISLFWSIAKKKEFFVVWTSLCFCFKRNSRSENEETLNTILCTAITYRWLNRVRRYHHPRTRRSWCSVSSKGHGRYGECPSAESLFEGV